MPVWLKVNQSVCTSCEFVAVRCDEKESHCDYPCYHHRPDLLVVEDPGERELLVVLWFLVSCLLYLVTYGLHRKNNSTTTRGGGEEGEEGKEGRLGRLSVRRSRRSVRRSAMHLKTPQQCFTCPSSPWCCLPSYSPCSASPWHLQPSVSP